MARAEEVGIKEPHRLGRWSERDGACRIGCGTELRTFPCAVRSAILKISAVAAEKRSPRTNYESIGRSWDSGPSRWAVLVPALLYHLPGFHY